MLRRRRRGGDGRIANGPARRLDGGAARAASAAAPALPAARLDRRQAGPAAQQAGLRSRATNTRTTPYVPATQLSPSGIAIVPDGSRAYVGLANASYVLSFGLTSAGLSLPGHPILLNEGARGAARVRLNVDPYRYVSNPGQAGVFVGAETGEPNEALDEQNANGQPQALDVEKRRYLYAIAKDGTVRVINVFLPGAETECETNIDPMNLPRRRHGEHRVHPGRPRSPAPLQRRARAFTCRRCPSTWRPPTSGRSRPRTRASRA